MKRVFVMLIAGTLVSGAAAVYASSTAQAVEKTPSAKPQKGAAK